MPRQYESSNALCPFYRMESTREIWCEGWLEGMNVRISFIRSAHDFKTEFCRAAWEQCPVAMMLNEIYDAAE